MVFISVPFRNVIALAFFKNRGYTRYMFLIIEFNIMENIPIEKFIVKVYSTPSCL